MVVRSKHKIVRHLANRFDHPLLLISHNRRI